MVALVLGSLRRRELVVLDKDDMTCVTAAYPLCAWETGHRVRLGEAELVQLSRATLANVRQNVAVAVGLKLVFLVTTVTGMTGLWVAILADTGATVLVTLNALRLLGWTPGRQAATPAHRPGQASGA